MQKDKIYQIQHVEEHIDDHIFVFCLVYIGKKQCNVRNDPHVPARHRRAYCQKTDKHDPAQIDKQIPVDHIHAVGYKVHDQDRHDRDIHLCCSKRERYLCKDLLFRIHQDHVDKAFRHKRQKSQRRQQKRTRSGFCRFPDPVPLVQIEKDDRQNCQDMQLGQNRTCEQYRSFQIPVPLLGGEIIYRPQKQYRRYEVKLAMHVHGVQDHGG